MSTQSCIPDWSFFCQSLVMFLLYAKGCLCYQDLNSFSRSKHGEEKRNWWLKFFGRMQFEDSKTENGQTLCEFLNETFQRLTDIFETSYQSLLRATFSHGHATLHLAVLVGWSVHRSRFWIASGCCITAPAKPSATVLPCIRPCFD